ncbi:unnamed protein product [Heterobilharzia americana]|nr:unnamed protein product [Heterobilharzia americana]
MVGHLLVVKEISFTHWVPESIKCVQKTRVGVEIETLRTTLSNNRCPKTSNELILKKRITLHPKKILTMNVEFKGDITAEVLKNHLSRCINSSFYAARLRPIFSICRLIRKCVKDRLPLMSTSKGSHTSVKLTIFDFVSGSSEKVLLKITQFDLPNAS